MVVHNDKGYGGHLIINEQRGNKSMDDTPNSKEKLMTFSILDLKFIDGFQVMASSLDSLDINLYENEDMFNNFNHLDASAQIT